MIVKCCKNASRSYARTMGRGGAEGEEIEAMRYVFADCLLDTQCYLLRRAGQSIRLQPKVFQVLTYLLTHRDRVIPKQELCEQIWPAPTTSDATIENCLKALRHALGDNGHTQRHSEAGLGQVYRFAAVGRRPPGGKAHTATGPAAALPVPAAVASQAPPASLDVLGPPSASVPLALPEALPVDEW